MGWGLGMTGWKDGEDFSICPQIRDDCNTILHTDTYMHSETQCHAHNTSTEKYHMQRKNKAKQVDHLLIEVKIGKNRSAMDDRADTYRWCRRERWKSKRRKKSEEDG